MKLTSAPRSRSDIRPSLHRVNETCIVNEFRHAPGVFLGIYVMPYRVWLAPKSCDSAAFLRHEDALGREARHDLCETAASLGFEYNMRFA